jgi:hypothetical protein
MGVLQSQQPEQVDGMGRRLDVEVTGLAGARRGCLLVGNLDVTYEVEAWPGEGVQFCSSLRWILNLLYSDARGRAARWGQYDRQWSGILISRSCPLVSSLCQVNRRKTEWELTLPVENFWRRVQISLN